jgi:hypothetical protein
LLLGIVPQVTDIGLLVNPTGTLAKIQIKDMGEALVALRMSAFGGKADMTFCAARLLMTQSGHRRLCGGRLMKGRCSYSTLNIAVASLLI